MRASAMQLLVGLALAGLGSAGVALDGKLLRSALVKRAVTPDNTCGLVNGGANNGYTCAGSNLPNGGQCCSASGYCGASDGYCGTGCQAAYGTCGTGTTTAAPPAGPTTTTATIPTPTGPPNTNTYECGKQFGNQICADTYCCSQNGYCGKTDAYCGTGCQTGFGTCGSVAPPTTGGGLTVSPDGTCGMGTNYICPLPQCCSSGGWCGTGADYCTDPDCQDIYGACDSSITPAGASTASDPRPNLGSISYTADLYDCVQAKSVALTFDDGPNAVYTPQLLDTLKQYGFTATFFMTGNNLHKGEIDTTAPFPNIIQRMIAEGHQVASHTWSHYNLSGINETARVAQMTKNERAIANVLGFYPTYMRPPYSDCSQASGCWATMEKLGYHRTYFDLDTTDYLNDSPTLIKNAENVVLNALTGAPAGGDFLAIQHDIHQYSVQTLSPYFFDQIKKKGWTGVTVGECMNDPAVNWYRMPGTGVGVDPYTNKVVAPTTTAKSTTTATVTTTANVITTAKTTSTTKKSTTTAKPTPTPTKKVRRLGFNAHVRRGY